MIKHVICSLMAFTLIACASYSARTVPILAPGSYSYQQPVDDAGDIVIAADLYDTETKYQSVFDTAPSYERGYLGINVLVFNDSDAGVLIDPANVTCLAVSGTVHQPISAEQVAEQVLRSTTGRTVAGVATLGVLGGLAGTSSSGANHRIRTDFANKGLQRREFPAGARGQGFVFCPNEEPLRALAIQGIALADQEAAVEIEFPPTRAYLQ